MSDRDLMAIVLEDVSRKFDFVLEGIDGLNQKMERYRDEANDRFERVEAAIRFTNVDLRQRIDGVEERLTKRIDAVDVRLEAVEVKLEAVEVKLEALEVKLEAVEVKLDAVADDVAAHRADTESHTLYRVKEEG
jgi:phage shock protein A